MRPPRSSTHELTRRELAAAWQLSPGRSVAVVASRSRQRSTESSVAAPVAIRMRLLFGTVLHNDRCESQCSKSGHSPMSQWSRQPDSNAVGSRDPPNQRPCCPGHWWLMICLRFSQCAMCVVRVWSRRVVDLLAPLPLFRFVCLPVSFAVTVPVLLGADHICDRLVR